MTILNLKGMSVSDLLNAHEAIIVELRSRNVLRSQNSPVADYAEWLVSTKVALSLSGKSQSGFDATDEDGVRYQIKARHLTHQNKSTQLGVIRNLANKNFDYLVGIIFDSNYSVLYAAKIPYNVVARLASIPMLVY